ncbi:MAG: IPExxxVDY family protein [Chitinophagaceae bacterium]
MSTLKMKLDYDSLMEEFFDSTHLIGMVSSVKDYQLCWQINHALNFDFRVNNELEISWKKKRKQIFFTVFEYLEPIKSVAHYLYNNHFRAEFLLPELKNVDYLWMIKGNYYGSGEMKGLMEELRLIPEIQMVTLLSLSDIKNKENLIF